MFGAKKSYLAFKTIHVNKIYTVIGIIMDFNKKFLFDLDLLDEGTFGVAGYGAKASSVLLQVRGKDFRHEKTKKKRGAYRGGEITFESNSFKYDDDDE